jgi:hypothetical protein
MSETLVGQPYQEAHVIKTGCPKRTEEVLKIVTVKVISSNDYLSNKYTKISVHFWKHEAHPNYT